MASYGTSPFMCKYMYIYIYSLLPTRSPIKRLHIVAYIPHIPPKKHIFWKRMVIWWYGWCYRYIHNPWHLDESQGPPCSSTWRPRSCSTLGPRKKCLRGEGYPWDDLNVNPGWINPVYGCLVGRLPSKSIRWNDYWRSTPLINNLLSGVDLIHEIGGEISMKLMEDSWVFT